jgi:23S rRNA pseudouridine1911/1915/1917 synthase
VNLRLLIDPDFVGLLMRLDKRVGEEFGLSRRRAQRAVERGQVDVAGRTCLEPGREVGPETPLAYSAGRPRSVTETRRLRVLYEDRHILIVDKPAGVLTQPTPARERDTLLERAGRYLTRTRGSTRPYVGIVHRIDKNSSGVTLLVCSPRALRPFQALFRDHAIDRSYLAVVEGSVTPVRGTIDRPLVANRGDGRRGTARVLRQGTPAITHYEVIEQFGGCAAHLVCRLETGRTHQIRIHLAEAGHPLVGDPVYRPRAFAPFPVQFPRQALHAQLLGFIHPLTGQAVRIEARTPDDIMALLATLRNRFGSQHRSI